MTNLKMFSLAVMAAAALTAFTGSASAATLTSPAGTNYSGTLTMTATESILWKAGFANVTCTESTISEKVETNNAELASGKHSTLTFGGCNTTVHVLRLGATVVHHLTGTVTEIEDEVTIASGPTTCVYGGAAVDVGRLESGTPARLSVNASLTKVSGGFLCANPASFTGKYTVTTPSTLIVD